MATSVLDVRVNDDERSLPEAVSAQACTNLIDFVRRKALEAAEIHVLERTCPYNPWRAMVVRMSDVARSEIAGD